MEQEFIASNNRSKSDFYADFFETRLWIKFLEMKKIPQEMYHWINLKIFDESIVKKERDYLFNKFKKVETPFLDEINERILIDSTFKPPVDYNSPEKLEEHYYTQRDSQNTLIANYITTDDSELNKSKTSSFGYKIFPCFVDMLLPNNTNFTTDRFAPDLSKKYVLNSKSLKQMKIMIRTKHYLNTIK